MNLLCATYRRSNDRCAGARTRFAVQAHPSLFVYDCVRGGLSTRRDRFRRYQGPGKPRLEDETAGPQLPNPGLFERCSANELSRPPSQSESKNAGRERRRHRKPRRGITGVAPFNMDGASATAPEVQEAERQIAHVPLVLNRRNFNWLTQRITGVVEQPAPRWWWVCFMVTASIATFGLFCIGYQISTGVGTWGNQIPIGWYWDLTNFVFWIGIGHAGTR